MVEGADGSEICDDDNEKIKEAAGLAANLYQNV